MAEKKEGAEMNCRNCGTPLVCRMKTYDNSSFAPKLQWQNEDGTAHYSTKDGKEFTCNVPNEIELKPTDKNQTSLEQPNTLAATDRDLLQSILHIVSDIKTEGVKIRDE